MADGERLCCNVCGKYLTEDTGLWNVLFRHYGSNDKPDEGFRCCEECKADIIKAVSKIIHKRSRVKIFSWG